MKKILLTATIVSTAFFAAPAFADCVTNIGKAEEAIKTATLDEATKAKVTTVLETAKKAQNDKDEAACESANKELFPLLGLTY